MFRINNFPFCTQSAFLIPGRNIYFIMSHLPMCLLDAWAPRMQRPSLYPHGPKNNAWYIRWTQEMFSTLNQVTCNIFNFIGKHKGFFFICIDAQICSVVWIASLSSLRIELLAKFFSKIKFSSQYQKALSWSHWIRSTWGHIRICIFFTLIVSWHPMAVLEWDLLDWWTVNDSVKLFLCQKITKSKSITKQHVLISEV